MRSIEWCFNQGQLTEHFKLRECLTRITYAAAAPSLPATATNHVTLMTYWRSSAYLMTEAKILQ